VRSKLRRKAPGGDTASSWQSEPNAPAAAPHAGMAGSRKCFVRLVIFISDCRCCRAKSSRDVVRVLVLVLVLCTLALHT
jgi:hypothetical protein